MAGNLRAVRPLTASCGRPMRAFRFPITAVRSAGHHINKHCCLMAHPHQNDDWCASRTGATSSFANDRFLAVSFSGATLAATVIF